MGFAFLLVAIAIEPLAAIPTSSRAAAASRSTPAAEPAPAAVVAADDFQVAISQSSMSYDTATNRSAVAVTVAPDAAVPWTWIVAVRGRVVASGSSSDSSITTTVTNDCSITSKSVTTRVTDSLGRTADAAATLSASLCPPPPTHRYDRDLILARPTLNETSFVDRLRAADSPALQAGPAIYRRLVRTGVNPSFALGMFHAESHSGTAGYAVITKNWGNILFYSWTRKYGATPYAPGNGYTYAKFPTWKASVRALAALFRRYWNSGYRTVGSTSARWLGTRQGSKRHLRYLNNIVAAMTILPDDSNPTVTRLALPSKSGPDVLVRWSATDNRGVTGYQVKRRKGSHAWSAPSAQTARSTVLTLNSGTWTIAVRARDAAGNWSAWRKDTVKVTH
jgi:hypothetical protein